MMKAAGRVNRPMSNSMLPIISMRPARITGKMGIDAGAAPGKPKNLVSPCCRKSSATTIRSRLSMRGVHEAKAESLTNMTFHPSAVLQVNLSVPAIPAIRGSSGQVFVTEQVVPDSWEHHCALLGVLTLQKEGH